jgi:Yip1 domain
MTENATISEPVKRFRFDWLTGVIFHPGRTFEQISAQTKSSWLVPILLLTITTIARVLVAGHLRQGIMLNAGPTLPPNFEYYSPEQQAQFMQAAQATSGPVFVYVFPLIVALLGIWIGWLLVGALLHLVVTLMGGRGDTGYSINLVAWASIPFAILDIIRTVTMLVTKQLIESPGLVGFAPASVDGSITYLASLLSLVNIFLIWHIILLIIGVRKGNGLSLGKASGGVIVTVGLVIAVQALISFLVGKLGGLTIIRPFF